MKESFGAAVNASADDKIAQNAATVAQNRKVADLETLVAALERRVTTLENAPKPSGGCCVIA